MTWGKHLKDLIEVSERGKRVKAIEDAPDLLPGLEFYITAYLQLCYDRPIGMTAGPIPWSSVIKYCHLHGIYDIDEIETFLRYIRALETAENRYHETRPT